MFRSRFNSFLDMSVRIGHISGIPINLHITILFFLLPALSRSGLGIWHGVEYALLVVLSILLHELGHAYAAKYYKLRGLSIMLHGFGGFALSSGARTPTQSLVISLAGPAVTFALGLLCLGIGSYGLQQATFGTEAYLQFYLIDYLGSMNILLGFLNLIPSLPFDGGQALVAILSRRMGEFKAMRAVGHLGLAFCPPLALFGFLTGRGFFTIFGLMGAFSSASALMNSGGIRFGEFFADRKARQEMIAVKRREEAKTREYLDDVRSRAKEREERERLRKLFESSLDDE